MSRKTKKKNPGINWLKTKAICDNIIKDSVWKETQWKQYHEYRS